MKFLKWIERYKSILVRSLRVMLALGIAFLLVQFPLDYLESWTYDLRVQTTPSTKPSGNILLIAVDPNTIEYFKRNPNAADHAKLLQILSKGSPQSVVYTQSPSLLDGTYEDMSLFAQASETIPNFYVAANEFPVKGQDSQLKLDPPLDKIQWVPGPTTSDLKIFAKDDVTRRLIFSYYGSPTLHAIIAEKFNGLSWDDSIAPKVYQGLFEFIGTWQAYIDFKPSGSYEQISFSDIINGKINPSKFLGKVLFVGTDTVMSSADYIRTPYSREIVAMSTLEMHANILDTLINNSATKKTPNWIDLLLTGLISILTVYVVLTLRPARGLLILMITLLLFCTLSYFSFMFFDLWIQMAHPMLAIFICYYFFIPYRLIIENRRSWEYFQRNKLLTQVEELKSNFLRMMSHDLKTPLARIQGMAEIVQGDPNPLSPKQKDAIERINRSSEELAEFISSILSLGRIESKEIKLHLKSKDINLLLTEVLNKCEDLAAKKNIQVITEFEPMFSAKMDDDLMKQVFTNLIENAIKYSPDDSRILISTDEANGFMIIQVADQGLGIAQEELNNIFDKFYRSNGVKNSSVKGSGLGLYLANYFVELHNGKISVDSELGKGSTFTVTLPMNLEAEDHIVTPKKLNIKEGEGHV